MTEIRAQKKKISRYTHRLSKSEGVRLRDLSLLMYIMYAARDLPLVRLSSFLRSFGEAMSVQKILECAGMD
jgi:hypothetical protein